VVVVAVRKWNKGPRPGRVLSWRPPRAFLEGAGGGAQVAAVTLTAPIARRSYNRWGATAAEIAGAMPGDEMVPLPKMTSTRAISIGAPPGVVWAWLVQIGRGRGGFYSFDALENMLRCDIHSADRIIPQYQELHAGDLILLAPAGAPCYRVAAVEPPHALVLVGADPKTRAVGPIPAGPEEMGMTWQWLLRPVDDGRSTRLVARQRYSYPPGQSVLWHLVEPVDFVMERRMLMGIKARAEARRGSVRQGRGPALVPPTA
jgi:hypothetical protein